MIQTSEELSEILKSTVLKSSNIALIEIPKSRQLAFAIEVPRETMLDCWHLMRSLVNITQMYPVLTNDWIASTGNWQDKMTKQDFFNRSGYLEEQRNGYLASIVPESIVEAAKDINGEEKIKTRIKESEPIADESWRESDWYLQELEETRRNFAVSPSSHEAEAALNSGKIITEIDFERWLFTWELENVPNERLLTAPDLTYLEWYDMTSAETIPLLLLPTQLSWNILAYMHFWGAINSAEEIAILKYWHDRYGAELVAHYGTMLQFYVTNKPQTLMEAFELASEHYEFAFDTFILPAVSIREHARALLHIDRWFLHDRP